MEQEEWIYINCSDIAVCECSLANFSADLSLSMVPTFVYSGVLINQGTMFPKFFPPKKSSAFIFDIWVIHTYNHKVFLLKIFPTRDLELSALYSFCLIFSYSMFFFLSFSVTSMLYIKHIWMDVKKFLNENLIDIDPQWSLILFYDSKLSLIMRIPVDTGRKLNVDKTSRTSSERLMYVQFTSCV